MAAKYSVAVRNAMGDALTAQAAGSALLRVYDNTSSVPADCAAGNGTNVLLAELTCNATFAPAASAGVVTLNAITNDSSANASGTLSYWRLYKADGTTCVAQGSAGSTGQDINFGVTAFVAGATIAVSGLTITIQGA
ncbi:MAG: hypothetical protein ABFE08_09015 [Armatimonadia bacterium]